MRILLVDESEVFLQALLEFLITLPKAIIVGAYRSGGEALVHAQELDPQLAFVDLEMHGSSGLETIGRLRSQLPQVFIVAMSLHDGAFQKAALKAGADEYIPKRYLPEKILPTIQRLQKEDDQ